MTARNTLNKQQTKALIDLWTRWRNNSNLKLNRLACSPYGTPYIVIERRDDDQTLGNWDWGITYHTEYDGQGLQCSYYSNRFPETMPVEIRDFLRTAWDKEFGSSNKELYKKILSRT